MNPNSNNLKTINYTQIVDLSHVIEPNIPIWQNDPLVEFEPVAELKKDGYYLRRVSMGEHSGTHINAPSSFYEDGVGLRVIRLSRSLYQQLLSISATKLLLILTML
ncbi:cyclase family protein [Trichocoleus sp. DQ-U1]